MRSHLFPLPFLLIGSLAFGGIAFAATSSDVLEEHRALRSSSPCLREDSVAKTCVSDTLKRLKALRHEFEEALEVERAAWYLLHGNQGVTEEYRQLLKAYLQEVAQQRRAWNEDERIIKAALFAVQKQARSQGAAGKGYSRKTSKSEIEKAAATTCTQKDESAQRLCLKVQLRLIDPSARQRGAVWYRTRGE